MGHPDEKTITCIDNLVFSIPQTPAEWHRRVRPRRCSRVDENIRDSAGHYCSNIIFRRRAGTDPLGLLCAIGGSDSRRVFEPRWAPSSRRNRATGEGRSSVLLSGWRLRVVRVKADRIKALMEQRDRRQEQETPAEL